MDMATSDLRASIVRVLDNEGRTVGAGFVISSQGAVATCNYIVQHALGAPNGGTPAPGSTVRILFELVGEVWPARVDPRYWRGANATDAVLLWVEGELPRTVVPVRLRTSADTIGETCTTFGFPTYAGDAGLWAKCAVLGQTVLEGQPALQLRSEGVTVGFGGAPVLHDLSGRVIGMVDSVASPTSSAAVYDIAFAIPAETMIAEWPEVLQVPEPGPPPTEHEDQTPSEETADSRPSPQVVDSVPTHPDPAVTHREQDRLQRAPFAASLARQIRDMRGKNPGDSFMLHLFGPWGSGKTSVLNFLRDDLVERPSYRTLETRPWIAVNFNAWQYQRVGSPWWWLLDAVFRQGTHQLRNVEADAGMKIAFRNRWRAAVLGVREGIWRFRTGPAPYLLTLVVLAMFLLLLGIVVRTDALGADLDKALPAIVALGLAASGTVFALSRWLLVGSARAAASFVDSTRDPMLMLSTHFQRLVTQLRYPVAVFIDDIDRCQPSYVVELLEGIQTLFREVSIVYVIAADRHWLCTCYEDIYGSFKPLGEPGRSLGYLFIEKLFQLTVPVPSIAPASLEAYWQGLLEIQGTASVTADDLKQELGEAERRVERLETEEDVIAELQSHRGWSVQDQAIRAAAVVRLSAPDIAARTEHALNGFAHLVESNPRAMKRLINHYGVQRNRVILSAGHLLDQEDWDKARKQIALWTILSLRWPPLANYLEQFPERVGYLINGPLVDRREIEDIPQELQRLFRSQAVRDVIRGKGVGVRLDERGILACLSIPLSPSRNQTMSTTNNGQLSAAFQEPEGGVIAGGRGVATAAGRVHDGGGPTTSM